MASPRGSRLACTGGTDAGLVAGERRDSTRRKDDAMMYGRLTVNPVHAAWNTLARFDDYRSAQRGGERDFSARRGLWAAHYDLIAREGGTERARVALEQAGLLPAEAPLT